MLLLWPNIEVHAEGKLDIDGYCKITCNKAQHTICAYKCKLGPMCIEFKHNKLTDDMRIHIRDLHNRYRNNVASGNDTRGGNDAGKDVMVMNYHKDIEITALCWARRCTFRHDKCRTVMGMSGGAGQNLFEIMSTGAWPGGKKIMNLSTKSWYSEIKLTNKDIIDKFHTESGKMIGHFTQMMWAKTRYAAI